MRKTILIVLLMVFSLSFAQDKKQNKENKLDKQLVGSWSGSEKDQQRTGVEKHWIQHRFEDGTFVLLFMTIDNGAVDKFIEKGQWWIEDGKFYELHTYSGLTDIYDYKVLDKNHVKFKSTNLAIDMEVETYEFIDTRLEE